MNREKKKAEIITMAGETLKVLFKQNEITKSLFDKATGYAVFENTKIALGISGGGGVGVAVDKASGEKTYMKMATVSLIPFGDCEGIFLKGLRYPLSDAELCVGQTAVSNEVVESPFEITIRKGKLLTIILNS